jgi:DNA-binding NarL/FixJ family response regulator
MERLDKWDSSEEAWLEILVEDRHATPADTARVRLDFRHWLKTLPRRNRKIALVLANGHRTTDIARKYQLCDGRVSQLRNELQISWQILMLC